MNTNRITLHRALPVALLTGILALAGCAVIPIGLGDGGDGGGVPPNVGGPPAADLPIDADPGPGGATRVEPVAGVDDATPATIDRFEIGADGRTLVVVYWGGSADCFGLADVLVDDAGATPQITVLEGPLPGAAARACPAVAVAKTVLVSLDTPVLRDGSGHEPVDGEPIVPAHAIVVTPAEGIRGARAHPVTGFVLSADGRTLTAHYTGGVEGCYGLAAVDLEETGGVAIITLLEGTRPDTADACIEIGVAKSVEIVLERSVIFGVQPGA